jgi:hypothetical protein
VGQSYVDTSIEQNGAAVFAHQSQKTGNLDMEKNTVVAMQARIQRQFDAAVNTGVEGVDFVTYYEEDGTTVSHREVITEAYKAEVANAEALHKSLQSTKPEAAKIFGAEVLGYSPQEGRALSAEEQVGIVFTHSEQEEIKKFNTARSRRQQEIETIRKGDAFLPDGSAVPAYTTDPATGDIVLPPITLPPFIAAKVEMKKKEKRLSTVRAETARLQSDPVYQNFAYQFQQAEAQLNQQAAAAAAAVAGGEGPVSPPVPPSGS